MKLGPEARVWQFVFGSCRVGKIDADVKIINVGQIGPF